MRDVNLSKFFHIGCYEQVRFAQRVDDLLRQAKKIIRTTEMFFKQQKKTKFSSQHKSKSASVM